MTIEPEVLVIGEALIDITDHGEGKPIHHVGGSPANVALGLGRLGRRVHLYTQLGADDMGDRARAHLNDSNVVVVGDLQPRTSTAVARIQAGGHAQYTFDISWDAFSPPALPPAPWIHTGSIAAFLEPGADSVLETLRARTSQARVSIDPNIRPALLPSAAAARERFGQLAELAHVVKMSDEDAAVLFPGASLDLVLDRLLEAGVETAAITSGAEGARIATASARVRVPAVRTRVIDTIGAGDTFMASIIDSLVAGPAGGGAALEELGHRAAALAAITVSRAGADLPWAGDT